MDVNKIWYGIFIVNRWKNQADKDIDDDIYNEIWYNNNSLYFTTQILLIHSILNALYVYNMWSKNYRKYNILIIKKL